MSSVKNITEHKFPLYQPGKLGGSHHTVVHTISPLSLSGRDLVVL